MNPQETVKDFLSGKLDIVTFRRMYDEGNEINDFLQRIIDDMKANHTQPLSFTKIIGGQGPAVVCGPERGETQAVFALSIPNATDSCFLNKEYEKALELVRTLSAENLYQQVGKAFSCGKIHLKLGNPEAAKEYLQFVITNGNKLHCVNEARALMKQYSL